MVRGGGHCRVSLGGAVGQVRVRRGSEHPRPEEQEAQHGRREVGGDQTASSVSGGVPPAAFRAASEPLVRASPMPKTTRPSRLVAHGPVPAAYPEGEAPVGGRVGDRRDGRASALASGPWPRKTQQRGRQRTARRRRRTSWRARTPGRPREPVERQLRRRQPGASASAPEVVGRRPHDVDRGCRGRRPSRPAPRGCAGRPARRAPASRCRRTSRCPRPAAAARSATSPRIALKPHCASEKRAGERAAQDQVVAARDELPLGPRTTASAGPAGSRSPGPSGRRSAAPPAAAGR